MLKLMVSFPLFAFDSSTAARSEQLPGVEVSQIPLPRFASWPSPVTFTTKVFATAKAVGWIMRWMACGKTNHPDNIDSEKKIMIFRMCLVLTLMVTFLSLVYEKA